MKKTRRDNSKYPNLDIELNTKRRRYYMDNVEYVDGVLDQDGKYSMRPLNKEEKEFLNKFNGEYYNAEFDSDDSSNLHKTKVDSTVIANVRESLSKLRARTKRETCPVALKSLYNEIEELTEYLQEVYPRKGCTDANNARNRCLVNKARVDNSYKLISVETMKQSELETASEGYNDEYTDFSIKEINYILEGINEEIGPELSGDEEDSDE
jgi:hypothetical protein